MEWTKRFVCWFLNVQSVLLWWYYNDKKAYRILAVLRTIQDVGSLELPWDSPGVHTMSDELKLQISCNISLAFKWISMMRSGQNISHYTTAKPSVHVWNHDLIWWQNKIDTQKTFPQDYDNHLLNLSKTKIPITIVKAQIPSNPNQKSRMRDNKHYISRGIHTLLVLLYVAVACNGILANKSSEFHSQEPEM